jgi:hypothetical protein
MYYAIALLSAVRLATARFFRSAYSAVVDLLFRAILTQRRFNKKAASH